MIQTYQTPLKGRSIGIVFGSFAPLHQGHLDEILRAKKENDGGCIVVVCGYNGDKGEPLMPLKKRYRYVRELFAKDDLVSVHSINDSELGIAKYPNGWNSWLEEVKRIWNLSVDQNLKSSKRVWYVGEEDYFTGLKERNEDNVILLNRKDNPVSATMIRQNPIKNWDKISNPFKRVFSTNILIAGTASEGKSTLVQDLGMYFNAPASYEWAREYMKESCVSDWELDSADYMAFLQGQYELNKNLINSPANHGVFFADTDSMVTQMYAEYYAKDISCALTQLEYEKIAVMAEEITAKSRWDKIFIIKTQGVFVDDHERFMAHSGMKERTELFNILYKLLANTLDLTLTKHSNKEGKCQTYCMSQGLVGGRNHPLSSSLYDLQYNKHIPKDYFTASLKDRLKLIAGLIDSDGSLSRGTYDWINKNKQLAFDFVRLINSCGLRATIKSCQKACGDFVGDYWRVCIGGEIEKIPVIIPRKIYTIKNRGRNALHESFTIEPIGEGEYFGFSTDRNHLFMLDDCTVVHNSTGAAYIFSKLKMAGFNAELVPEFAKDKVWEESKEVFRNQAYIFGKQYFRITRVENKVDIIVTDSPLLLSAFYNQDENLGENFNQMVLNIANNYDSLNYFLMREKPYNPAGRFQTEEESDQISYELKEFLIQTKQSPLFSGYGNQEFYDSIVYDIAIHMMKLN